MTMQPITTTGIPADWDITDPTTWTLSQTVDAHLGSAGSSVSRPARHTQEEAHR